MGLRLQATSNHLCSPASRGSRPAKHKFSTQEGLDGLVVCPSPATQRDSRVSTCILQLQH
ncbi:hypothetical protein HAX54_038810, partial [Datura stramonium]|nr:hypothetical protein [Datura stramonium]